MAHRNIKITCDIAQTCNKLYGFNKFNLCTLPPFRVSELTKKVLENSCTRTPHTANTVRNECKEPARKILSETNLIEYMTPEIDSGETFPVLSRDVARTLESNKFDINKIPLGTVTERNISSAPFTATRFYSTKKKDTKPSCKILKKKCFTKQETCPRFVPHNCPPTKGSDCSRVYTEVTCTKKLAPYPSYSELCAYRLEDDPSECVQCPWQKCGGIEDIKPQKKNYHTSTKPINTATLTTKSTGVPPYILFKKCDASKEPCKEPPPKCQRRRERMKKEKCPDKKKDKKKERKCELSPIEQWDKERKCDLSPIEQWVISGSMTSLELQKFYHNKAKVDQLREEIEMPVNLAQKIVFDLKDCPKPKKEEKNKPLCPPKRKVIPPDLDQTINKNYKPKDPCCEEAKKGRQPRKKPKVYVPEPRNY